jgi:hypothetical protein
VIVRPSQQPASVAQALDVDFLHGLLRQAESGVTYPLFGLYRDIIGGHAHTQGEFSKRKLAVLSEGITLSAQDPKNAFEVALAAEVQTHLLEQGGWIKFLSHCLDATLYPVALTARSYRPARRPGWRYEIAQLTPIPHVHLAWPDGILSIRETDDIGNFTGQFCRPGTRTHILHRSDLLPSLPDWWGGPMRALLFWWLFATMDRDWWARFLERFGAPFLVGRYPESDDGARWSLQDAFSAASRLFGIVVSNETSIEMKEANAAGSGDAFETFHSTANREISKLIIGQTSSAEIQTSGLGDSQGAAQAGVREDIRKYDAYVLAHMVKTQILIPLWYFNGWTSPIPNVSFGAITEEEAALTGEFLASLNTAGLRLTADGLEKLSAKYGYGIERIPSLPSTDLAALSAGPLTLLPSVASRAARQQQARRAVAALIENASPKLARLMRHRAGEFGQAIESADSPEAAAVAVAALAADYDPGTASDLISAVLSSSAANAILSAD